MSEQVAFTRSSISPLQSVPCHAPRDVGRQVGRAGKRKPRTHRARERCPDARRKPCWLCGALCGAPEHSTPPYRPCGPVKSLLPACGGDAPPLCTVPTITRHHAQCHPGCTAWLPYNVSGTRGHGLGKASRGVPYRLHRMARSHARTTGCCCSASKRAAAVESTSRRARTHTTAAIAACMRRCRAIPAAAAGIQNAATRNCIGRNHRWIAASAAAAGCQRTRCCCSP